MTTTHLPRAATALLAALTCACADEPAALVHPPGPYAVDVPLETIARHDDGLMLVFRNPPLDEQTLVGVLGVWADRRSFHFEATGSPTGVAPTSHPATRGEEAPTFADVWIPVRHLERGEEYALFRCGAEGCDELGGGVW